MTSTIRSGQGTVGALIMDPSVYEQLVTVLGGVARSRILRALVRFAIERSDKGRDVGREVEAPPPGATAPIPPDDPGTERAATPRVRQ